MRKIVFFFIVLLLFSSEVCYAESDANFIKKFKNKDYQQVIQLVNGDINKAKQYCDLFFRYEYDDVQFDKIEYWQSFKQFCDNKKGDCEDYTIAIASMVGETYPITLLDLRRLDFNPGHMVFLYKQNGKYGAVANDSAEPKYNSIDDMIKDKWGKYSSYQIYHIPSNRINLLRIFSGDLGPELINYRGNVKYVDYNLSESIRIVMFGHSQGKFNFKGKLNLVGIIIIVGIILIVILIRTICFRNSNYNFISRLLFSSFLAPFIIDHEIIFQRTNEVIGFKDITPLGWILTTMFILWATQLIICWSESVYDEKVKDIELKIIELTRKSNLLWNWRFDR